MGCPAYMYFLSLLENLSVGNEPIRSRRLSTDFPEYSSYDRVKELVSSKTVTIQRLWPGLTSIIQTKWPAFISVTRGSTELQGVFERRRRKQSWGVHGHVSLRYFTVVRGMGLGAYSVKYGNKCLEGKNNSNEIILIGFFLKFKGIFLFLTFKRRFLRT